MHIKNKQTNKIYCRGVASNESRVIYSSSFRRKYSKIWKVLSIIHLYRINISTNSKMFNLNSKSYSSRAAIFLKKQRLYVMMRKKLSYSNYGCSNTERTQQQIKLEYSKLYHKINHIMQVMSTLLFLFQKKKGKIVSLFQKISIELFWKFFVAQKRSSHATQMFCGISVEKDICIDSRINFSFIY